MRATAQTSTRSPFLSETVAKITRIVAYQEAIIYILKGVLPKSHTPTLREGQIAPLSWDRKGTKAR